MKKILLLTGFLSAALLLRAQTPAVSNLAELTNGSAHPGGSNADRFASSFTLGGTGSLLSNVTLSVPSTSANLILTGFTVELYSDISSHPGTLLETLSGNASPNAGLFSYTSGGLALSANTTYWVVTRYTGNSGFGYNLDATASDAQTSSLGWTIGNTSEISANAGVDWSADPSVLKFSVSTSAVPEPSTYAALAGLAALGFVAYRRRR